MTAMANIDHTAPVLDLDDSKLIVFHEFLQSWPHRAGALLHGPAHSSAAAPALHRRAARRAAAIDQFEGADNKEGRLCTGLEAIGINQMSSLAVSGAVTPVKRVTP